MARFATVIVLVTVGISALAQHRVNTQIYGNTGPSVRFSKANYSAQSQLLPSENRNLYYRSGALPSQVRMNYRATGPLAPQGFAAYVPQSGPQYRVGSVGTNLNYVNTQVAPGGATIGRAPSYVANGSLKYSPARAAFPTPSSSSGFPVNSATLFPSVQSSASSMNSIGGSSPINNAPIGSVRFGS